MYCTLVREFAAKIFMASALSSVQLLSTTINSHSASEGARNSARLPRTTRKLSQRLYVQRITLINSILGVRLSIVGHPGNRSRPGLRHWRPKTALRPPLAPDGRHG